MTAALSTPEAPVSMASSARRLAQLHALSDQQPDLVASLSSLSATLDWLHEASLELSERPGGVKAAEWLTDNLYVLDRAALTISESLPVGYYSLLPALTIDGALPPRVYAVARNILHATNLQLTTESVTGFVSAYQEVETFELAELWALPTMLRLNCVEVLVSAVRQLAPDFRAPFEDADSDELPFRLDETECVARSVRSLAALDAISWPDFVEATSGIDDVLRNDPAAAYSKMDAQTRDSYRRAVEELARGSHHDEHDVARRSLALAASAAAGGRASHVGFWLVAEGRERLERALRYRPRRRDRGRAGVRRHATGVYLTAVLALTASFALLPALYLARSGATTLTWVGAVVLFLVPASMPAVALLHWTLARILPSTVLPKLAFHDAIPREFKTAVTIPSLLTGRDDVRGLLAQIERHRLSNPDPNLRFVLLTGFGESKEPHTPQDAALLDELVVGIAELNRRDGESGPFHLFHRERSFNPVEGLWMGWERKRGKLDEFNRLLQGDEETGFQTHVGDPDGLEEVRFVLTLDADTALPPGTAARLIGTLAHPLNRAEVDPVSGQVRAGYTIVQPRIETSPESGNRSLFTRLFCGDTAIDIYSRAVSDVYQDLFATGIYVGKAIYDVHDFSKSLHGRFPENALASHDLFEGIHGRAALATDIVLYEDYPPTYFAFIKRLHRWVRGDWQLLPWLRRRVPGASQAYLPNRFAAIDRWKMTDNLRRSLFPTALLFFMVSGWTWLPGHPLVWTLFAVLAPTGNLLIDVTTGVAREHFRPSRDFSRSVSDQLGRWFLFLVFLPHQAWVTGDAIVRTLIRVILTKRHLLEWTTSAQAAASTTRRHMGSLAWSEMAVAPATALSTGVMLAFVRPVSLPFAAPLLVLWAVSPEIARRISKPTPVKREQLAVDDLDWLRTIARRTWFFFESFVGPDGHWLPPDNYQEDPNNVVAERTSPTNIGMLLVSTFAAYDFGYVGLEQLTSRLRHSLRTVERLDQYRGHLLNWYDIRTLEPLEPRYVSTVDSGNLAASLLVVQSGLADLSNAPILPPERWQGLVDTIAVLRDSSLPLVGDDPSHAAMIEDRAIVMQQLALQVRDKPDEWARTALALEVPCLEIEGLLVDTVAEHRDSVDLSAVHDLRFWLARVHSQILDMQQEIEFFAPWLAVLDSGRTLFPHHDAGPALEELGAKIAELLAPTISLGLVGPRCDQALAAIVDRRRGCCAEPCPDDAELMVTGWLEDLETAVAAGAANARQLETDVAELSTIVERQTLGMDFGWLYDPQVRHFFIGYNVSADQMDPHHYDLLASEARLTSFVAIAKGDVPVTHWFSLDRPLTRAEGSPGLISWGGTMFEYLMPPLLLRSQPGTLLDVSQRTAVLEQIADGRRRNIPWGISESGFAAFDADDNYQYQAFGVQGLGRKRGLDDDQVIAPYATALALPLFPSSATLNLRRLNDLGMLGNYGFYEAIDFTPSRLPQGRDHAIVLSYMSHHQGMTLAALDNLLCDDVLVRRFEANARVQATGLLLQERVPGRFPVEAPRRTAPLIERPPSERSVALFPWRGDPAGAKPGLHVLGNGQLASRITEAGGGALSWRQHAITRAIPDGTLDDAGLWIYVRDRKTGAVWSAGRQPTSEKGASIDVVLHAHMVELHRRQNGISIRTDIAIGAADDIEVRRITVVNESDQPRSLSFTSYGEVVLAPSRDDARHPAFSKLFIEGTHVPTLDALIFTRTPRSPDEQFPVVMHRLVTDSATVTFSGFETDRAQFVSRNSSMGLPTGIEAGLAGGQGATLDPIMALSATVELEPFATEQFAFVTIAGFNRQSVNDTAARYDTLTSFEWLIADAHAEAEREAHRLKLDAERLPELQQLLSSVLAPSSPLRAEPELVASNRLGQQDLWALGISGDDPLLLALTKSGGQGTVLADLFRAHQLWRERGVSIDLVVLSHAATWDEVHRLLTDLGAAEWLGRRAGVHLVRADQISEDQRQLLTASAAAILDGDAARLGDQLARDEVATRPLPQLNPTRSAAPISATPALQRPANLQFDNGLGGFSADGREYVIHLEPGHSTPAPWCNVLANDDFGTLVTEAGGGYTWAGNSGEFRLTPWTNDPVLDAPGESLYLRDEETVEVWSPTPGPAGSEVTCQVRHGAGYSEWRQRAHGLETCVRVFVPTNDPVKIVELRVHNHEDRPRRITATYYARWLLGRTFEPANSHVVVDYDAATRSLRARNRWNSDFADTVAFLASDREPHGFTADRAEFLGPEGNASSPAALGLVGLAGTTGSNIDPCGCLQVHLNIGPGEEIRTHFVLGAGTNEEHTTELVRRWQDQATVDEASKQLDEHWDTILSAVTVQTPEPALDLLLNRWALYQVLSSRILARTGFYQSSGAYGFRDQLQDVLAIMHCDPARTRAHILESASRQFEEGDVLHWWHPPLGRGVRTRCSDDLLWLPYVTSQYVQATGDLAILDEDVPFLSAAPLAQDEPERYALFQHQGTSGTLFEHCQRALERGLTRGPHGLPLIGDGDWNDGMNRVGSNGRGESVWLGWFAGATTTDFATLCDRLGESAAAGDWRHRAQEIFDAVNSQGWDGAWYRRAFDDNGEPWGSSQSDECQIDSIAQSWAVLSGGAPQERNDQALRSAQSALVRDADQLACLLWPPFDLTSRDPGYIKAYPPGIRENGGQYSHAAAWLGWAFAEQGDGDTAAQILRMLNPIEHTQTPDAVQRYRLEPYAVAADIASVEPYIGRGGWNWYTGAAAWSWRLGVEAILGLRRLGDQLQIQPQFPDHWPGYRATLRTNGGELDISVKLIAASSDQADKDTTEVLVDGNPIDGNIVDLPKNGAKHQIAVHLTRPTKSI